MDKRSTMERSLDVDELGRIVCVLEACSRLLGNEPRFPASGKSVQEVVHNMAVAVKNYAAEERQEPKGSKLWQLVELGGKIQRLCEEAAALGMCMTVDMQEAGDSDGCSKARAIAHR